jgi:hypothetical protein
MQTTFKHIIKLSGSLVTLVPISTEEKLRPEGPRTTLRVTTQKGTDTGSQTAAPRPLLPWVHRVTQVARSGLGGGTHSAGVLRSSPGHLSCFALESATKTPGPERTVPPSRPWTSPSEPAGSGAARDSASERQRFWERKTRALAEGRFAKTPRERGRACKLHRRTGVQIVRAEEPKRAAKLSTFAHSR